MPFTIEFNKDVLATVIADIIEEEEQRPCGVRKKLRQYVKDGTIDADVRWVIEVITDAIGEAVGLDKT